MPVRLGLKDLSHSHGIILFHIGVNRYLVARETPASSFSLRVERLPMDGPENVWG